MKKNVIVLFVFVLAVLWGCGSKPAEESAEKTNPAAKTSSGSGDLLKVKVKKMTPEPFEHYFTVSGTVEAVKEAFISPETGGQIKKVHVKEGLRVREGELLVSLNADVIKNSIAEVKSALELVTAVYEKRRGLWEKKIGSEIQYLQAKADKESMDNRLKALQAQLAMTQIKSPVNGIVDDIFQKEGELSSPGVGIMQVVNLEKVFVNADVSESYLSKIRKGDTVTVSFPSYPELTMDVPIHRTGNVVKAQNRTFSVQLLLDNETEAIKPNMLAEIKLKDFSADAALVVPSLIIKNDLKGTYLYIAEKNGGKTTAKKVYVVPGMSDRGNTMVVDGLEPGAEVIVKGFHMVKSGMAVKIES